jgi:hypothetical protein
MIKNGEMTGDMAIIDTTMITITVDKQMGRAELMVGTTAMVITVSVRYAVKRV